MHEIIKGKIEEDHFYDGDNSCHHYVKIDGKNINDVLKNHIGEFVIIRKMK